MSKKAIHLGGGAYASITEIGELIITADHHEPSEASSAVYIQKSDIKLLAEFIKNELPKQERGQ